MKISKYNKFLEIDNKKYVFNSYTGSLAEINLDFYSMLEKIKSDKSFVSTNQLFLDMKKGGIIIENDFDEIIELEKNYWENRNNKDVIGFTILPTLNCNYNCPYCYEKKSKKIMSGDVIEKVVDFIREEAKDVKKIHIAWYGGEPLLAKQIVKNISDQILCFCKETNKKLAASMVSNGYFIDDDTAKMLAEINIKSCQITLDGTEQTHNSKRFNKKNNEGTFCKTLESIKKLNHVGIKVSIRFNIDKNNFEQLEELLICLKNNGINNSLNLGWLNAISEECSNIANTCLDYKNYCEYILTANKLLIKYGFANSHKDFYPKYCEVCSVINNGSFVINPNGEIFKCWNDIENTALSIGNVTDKDVVKKVKNKNRFSKWNPFNFEKCKNCEMLPICLGGCPYMAIKNNIPQCSQWKYNINNYLRTFIEEENASKEIVI